VIFVAIGPSQLATTSPLSFAVGTPGPTNSRVSFVAWSLTILQGRLEEIFSARPSTAMLTSSAGGAAGVPESCGDGSAMDEALAVWGANIAKGIATMTAMACTQTRVHRSCPVDLRGSTWTPVFPTGLVPEQQIISYMSTIRSSSPMLTSPSRLMAAAMTAIEASSGTSVSGLLQAGGARGRVLSRYSEVRRR